MWRRPSRTAKLGEYQSGFSQKKSIDHTAIPHIEIEYDAEGGADILEPYGGFEQPTESSRSLADEQKVADGVSTQLVEKHGAPGAIRIPSATPGLGRRMRMKPKVTDVVVIAETHNS